MLFLLPWSSAAPPRPGLSAPDVGPVPRQQHGYVNAPQNGHGPPASRRVNQSPSLGAGPGGKGPM
jgi:hypothetical protein